MRRPTVWSLLVLVLAGGCAGGNTGDLREGTSGLSGAIPGGDGRALAAYKAEFRANALAGMDSLMLRTDEVWQRDDRDVLATLYSPRATLVTPDGQLLVGGAAVRDYVSGQLPQMSSVSTWRDEFTASGEMTFIYGRYDADSSVPGRDSRGVHVTIAMRDHFNWQIRAKMYVGFEGAGVATDPSLLSGEPPHVSPDLIRARFGRRALNGQDERAEWAVSSYFYLNSYLSEWRQAWNNDDSQAAIQMMGDGVVIRLPFDVPALGKTNAAYSLERLLPAVGDLSLSILDFDISERLGFCLGAYTLNAGGQELKGYYMSVMQMQDDGPRLRALIFSGSGANQLAAPGSATVR